jgi:sugar lactone lactonase YvrE
MTAELVLQIQSQLGESALWAPQEQRLYWLDLMGPALYRFDPLEQRNESWELPLGTPLGGVVHTPRGLLLAAPEGLFQCDFDGRHLELWTDPSARPDDTRFNDCKVDRGGRLWLASKHVEEREATGQLYRVMPDGSSVVVDQGFACANGPAISPDGSRLYLADTTARRIFAYDLDLGSGAVSHRRIFAEFSSEDGEPDGMTVDAGGGLWVCHWGGWRVTRFLPNGQRDRAIALPVPQVTSCCFGGEDLRTLFITSASVDLTSADAARAPLAGSLFRAEVGLAGLEEPVFSARGA